MNKDVLQQFTIADLAMYIDYLQQNGDEYTWPILYKSYKGGYLKCDGLIVISINDSREINMYEGARSIYLSFYYHHKHVAWWDLIGEFGNVIYTQLGHNILDIFENDIKQLCLSIKKEYRL